MLLDKSAPPEGHEEDPEPEQEVPPEPVEGEEPPPPPSKLEPWLPKYTTLKCVTANAENSWMVGKEIKSPAYGKPTISFKAVHDKETVFLKNVMEAEPAVVFFDMPMPGSFAARPVLKGEDDKYKAGGVLGLLCVDTIGATITLSEDDKEILGMMGRVAGKTYERLVEEARQRKMAEDVCVAETFEGVVMPEEQAMAEEDEVEALEGKLGALDKHLVAKIKAVVKAKCPAAKEGEWGRSVAELVGLPAGTPSAAAAAAVFALVGATAESTGEEIEAKMAGFDIRACSEAEYAECKAKLHPEGQPPVTKDTAGVIFPAQLGLALIAAAELLKDMTLKIQKVRAEEEAAKQAEIKAAEEAAAAEAAAAEGA